MKVRDLRQGRVSRRRWNPSEILGAIPITHAPVFIGLDDGHTSVQVCILDREGKILGNHPHKNDRQTISAVVAGHFAKPREVVADL